LDSGSDMNPVIFILGYDGGLTEMPNVHKNFLPKMGGVERVIILQKWKCVDTLI